jgi:prophage maintenance system killer protein
MTELSIEDILAIHRLAIEKWGGKGGLNADTVACIGSVLHTATYNDGLIGYAAGVLCYFARAQHFPDGNKRVSWGSCVRVLELNGYTLSVDSEIAIAFVRDEIAVENLGVAEIAERISSWLDVLE